MKSNFILSMQFLSDIFRQFLFYSINILQGSVSTHFRCGRNFSDRFVANCLPNLPVKKF